LDRNINLPIRAIRSFVLFVMQECPVVRLRYKAETRCNAPSERLGALHLIP
jgi:hypothetical protein